MLSCLIGLSSTFGDLNDLLSVHGEGERFDLVEQLEWKVLHEFCEGRHDDRSFVVGDDDVSGWWCCREERLTRSGGSKLWRALGNHMLALCQERKVRPAHMPLCRSHEICRWKAASSLQELILTASQS